jgi:hypothetical protein
MRARRGLVQQSCDREAGRCDVRFGNTRAVARLEHVPEKLIDFSVILDIGYIRCLIDENMLQDIDFKRFLLDRMSPSDWKTP